MIWNGVMPAITTCFDSNYAVDHKFMVHCVVAVEAGCNRGHYAVPNHLFPPDISLSSGAEVSDMAKKLPKRTGEIGGRVDSGFQLNKNSVAGPQILPWHGA